MTVSIIVGVIVVFIAAYVPYLKARSIAHVKERDATEVIAEMANDINQKPLLLHRLHRLHHRQNSRQW